MALTFTNLQRHEAGDQFKITGVMTFDSIYAAGGESLTARELGLSIIDSMEFEDSGGYAFDAIVATGGASALIKAWRSAGFTPSGSIAVSAGTPASATNAAPTAVIDSTTFSYIKGAKNADHEDADQAASPTGGAHVCALEAADNTNPVTLTTQPDVARNVCIVHKCASGVAAVAQVAADYVVVGTFNGAAQTDTISFTDTSNIADTKFRVKYGTKPFDSITSITPSIAQNATIQRSAGIGTCLGLPNALFTPAEADVLKITKQGVTVAVAGTVTTAANTVNPGDITDNDDVRIKYKRKGYEAAPAITVVQPTFTAALTGAAVAEGGFNEVDASTNLSTLAIGFSAFGK